MFAPQPAQAYHVNHFYWHDDAYHINAWPQTFVDYINAPGGMSLTALEYRTWIAYAASKWNTDSGARLEARYDGDRGQQGCYSRNGHNEVRATPGCAESSCTALGYTHSWRYLSSLNEADICITGDSQVLQNKSWRLGAQEVEAHDPNTPGSPYFWDLGWVLAHEMGHAVGVDHSGSGVYLGVMDAHVFSDANGLRDLWADDIEGIRARYGLHGYMKARWSRYNPATDSWSTPTAFTFPTTHGGISAAIGLVGIHSWAVAAVSRNSDRRPFFARAPLPLSSSSQWSYVHLDSPYITDHAPAVIYAHGASSPRWLAAWSASSNNNSGNQIYVYRSSDAFSSGSIFQLGLSPTKKTCTNNSIALAWDTASGRYVMAYLGYAYTTNGSDHRDRQRIVIRTSSDGAGWTDPEEIGWWSEGGVSLACHWGTCHLLHRKATEPMPTLVSWSFQLDSGGTVKNIHGPNIDASWLHTQPATSVSGPGLWMAAMAYSYSSDDWARGIGDVYTRKSYSVPMPNTSWTPTGYKSYGGIALASNEDYLGYHYLFSLGY